MKYHKLASLLLAFIMAAVLSPLTAIAEENDPADPAEDTVMEAAKDPTEKPTEKPAEAPTEQPTEKPTETATEQPTEKPTEAPTATPKPELTEKNEQIVTIVNCKNSVNVRKGPGSKTAKIGTAPKGTKYKLLEVDGYWYKIQYKANVTGYIYVDYVKMGKGTPSQDKPEPKPSGEERIVTIVNCSIACNVRTGGSTSHAKIGTALKGSTYQYLGKSGNYYKIQYTTSKVGYVHKNYVKVSKGSVTPDPDDPPASGQIVTIANCKVNCNVRKAGSQSSKKIGVAPRDKQYQYLGKSGNYYKIQYTSSQVGYVHMSYAKISKGSITPDPDSKDKNQGKIVNCKSMVNVREEASSSSKLLGTLKLGSTVTIIKTVGKWTKIKYNGGEAYVFSKYVKIG